MPQRCVPLWVLDVGAGNGMVGTELRKIGAECLLGCDVLPEAAIAAERDCPGVYNDYDVVGDLIALSKSEQRLQDGNFNAPSLVFRLGFGNIPTAIFIAAFNLVVNGGLIVFNLKDEFVGHNDRMGFAQLVRDAMAKGIVKIIARHKYTHRPSITGELL